MTERIAAQGAAIRSYFDSVAPEYVRSRERQHSFLAQRELVLSLLPPGGRVLDVGCGPAVMADELLRRGSEVWGVDVAAQMIALGEERLRGHPDAARCRLRVGSLERLPYPDGAFDALIAMGVLEYVIDRPHALAEVHRVLRPGGIAVFTVPNLLSAYHIARAAFATVRRVARRLAGRPVARSERFATRRCVPPRLDRELAQAGLRKIDGRFCNFIFFGLHELHAGASLALNRALARAAGGRPAALLGAQYVVGAVRD